MFVAVQASYALHRSIGHYSEAMLMRLRSDAWSLFPWAADSDVGVAAQEASRRSPRSHGQHRRTLYTEEVKAIFCGVTLGTRAFRRDADVSPVHMLGLCTLLHHILFQETVRPYVGPLVHHGLGTLVRRAVPSPRDIPDRPVLMVGLVLPTELPNTQVGRHHGVLFAPYGINRPSIEELPNCEMEEEYGSSYSTVSFGMWDSPDVILRSNAAVSLVVVYPTTALSAGTELVWNYAGAAYP
jgi:hypothetical protein